MDFFCLETALAFCNNHPTTFSSYLYLIHLISTYLFDSTQSSDLISLKKTLLFFSFIYRPGLEQMLWAPVTWWMVVWGKFDRVLMLQVFSTCLSCHIQQSNLLFFAHYHSRANSCFTCFKYLIFSHPNMLLLEENLIIFHTWGMSMFIYISIPISIWLT